MYLIPFFIVDADLAERETRVIHTLVVQDGLPIGSYELVEFYCPDPACNCRRVMLNIVEAKHPDRFLASISYGFDRGAPEAGPFLDPLNPQSRYASALLKLVANTALSDPLYLARLGRHYKLVKQAASDPEHPAYARLQRALEKDRRDFPSVESYRSETRVGRNDPCPCGSGKKYKQCCGRRK